MRIHVLSDLHLEGGGPPFEPPPVAADVVVLAGDISTGARGVDWAKRLSPAFDGRPVLYVAGNHEFYGESFPALFDELRAAGVASAVRVLENDELVIGGVRFLGCTLWSDFCFDGVGRQRASMALCGKLVNDYRQIRAASDGAQLTPRETLERHLLSRAWLAERLAVAFDGPTVVITHHAPMIRRRPPSEVLRLIAGAFASDLSELMGADRVALWIYGHTHRPADLEVGGTRVVSNPRGYARESIAAFDPAGVYELRSLRARSR
ncbi:MAG: metallophosphoesterase [Solirubrobacteraceae bacterium]